MFAAADTGGDDSPGRASSDIQHGGGRNCGTRVGCVCRERTCRNVPWLLRAGIVFRRRKILFRQGYFQPLFFGSGVV